MELAIGIPVESGQPYTVAEVDGHLPQSLDDFCGEILMTLNRAGQVLQVTGAGSTPNEDSVRFYQKELALHDRDIRVWTITKSADQVFSAAPYAAF